MTHLVIRADGGPDIGYGHLVRTNAIAEDLRRGGHNVTFATASPDHVAKVSSPTMDTLYLDSRSNPEDLLDMLNSGVDAVVIDSYLADEEYQRAMRERFPLVVISDDIRHRICADVLVNGNLYAESLTYDVRGEDPEWCLGPTYVPLRDEISALVDREPHSQDPPERVLVSMGGSDIGDLTPTVVRSLDGFDITVDVIIGPGFSPAQERAVRSVAAEVSAPIEMSRDPANLPERMATADIAVCTASSTIYELLALGTPMVVASIAPNQDLIASALAERDLATIVEKESDPTAFREAIDAYVADQALRRSRSERGRDIVDGRGAKRVADVILAVAGGG